MSITLVRPYPVARLLLAKDALASAASGDLRGLQDLYRAASAALGTIDPDEVDEFLDEHGRGLKDDVALARAATAVADTWEGVVAIGAKLHGKRFRGFAWLCAQIRYELEPARRDASRLRAYGDGAGLIGTSDADAALYAALPALIGLGPELANEVTTPCPIAGMSVAEMLGVGAATDFEGVDPLDGIALTADACRAHHAAAPAEWRPILARGADSGLLVRVGEQLE